MSMFGSLGSILGGAAGFMLGGPAGAATGASLGGSIGGGIDSNEASAKQASKNRDFQEYMSNTAHTREVQDLRSAGLNPILSAHGTGASTPAGSVAPQNDVMTGAFATAMQTFKSISEAIKTQADTIISLKMPAKIEADTSSALSSAKLNDELFQNQSVIRSEINASRQLKEMQTDLTEKQKHNMANVIALAELEVKKAGYSVEGERLKNALLELDRQAAVETLKGLRNEGKIDESTFGSVMRYVDRFFKPITGVVPRYHFGVRN